MNADRYNFMKPLKLAAELEQRLLAWFKVALVVAPKKWAKVLPFDLGMTAGTVETVRPSDALAGMSEAAVTCRIAFPPEVVTLLTLPRPLVLAVVAGLLGDAKANLPVDRELTVVDQELFQHFLQDFLLSALQETWLGATPLVLAFEQLEPNPQWSRALADAGNLVACSFAFTGPFGEQACQWLVPLKGLLSVLGETDQQSGESPSKPVVPSPRLKQLVQEVPVELAVVLGTANLSLVQLARLAIGDTVILNQRLAEPLVASIGGDQKFRGWPGRVGTVQAFQIQSLTDTH
jgi:flagellar motor switch protein FliM